MVSPCTRMKGGQALIKKIFSNGVSSVLFIILFGMLAIACVYLPQADKQILGTHGVFTVIYLIPAVLLTLVLFRTFFQWTKKLTTTQLVIVERVLIFGIIGLQILTIIYDSYYGIFVPRDSSRCINEAIAMIEGQRGKINNTIYYFHKYANNNFFIVVMYYIFKVVKIFGVRGYGFRVVSMIVNMAMMDWAGVFMLKIITLCFHGHRTKLILLFSLLICPTTYLWILYPYTNTFSMPFVIGIIYVGVKILKNKGNSYRNVVQLGLLSGIGGMFRATTWISLIAVVIVFAIVRKKWYYSRRNNGYKSC